MSSTGRDVLADLERTIRVSDQSSTAYAILRDRYRTWSTRLDSAILLLSAWLTALVWVQPSIADQLTPFRLPREIWVGLLSVGTFSLALIQLQVNWKARANAFHQAMTVLSTYVKELRPLRHSADIGRIETALDRYQAITEPLEPIPEADFLKLKQRHLRKVRISRHLDRRPGTNLTLLAWALRWRDNRATMRDEDDEATR